MTLFDFKKKPQTKTAASAPETKLLWEDMNFAATEAYNLLRTNLTLSFADNDGARFVGITSTEHAEGKSLTSINLAASLAKGNHKTLLLECDLRLPVVAKYTKQPQKAGLSELLVGMASSIDEAICPVEKCENLSVICCGRIPPNPSELLGSARMEKILSELGERFEYIIVDLPPIGAVSDALVLAKKLSGMILVVRNNVTTQPAIADAIRQLQYTGARIIGFVYNDANLNSHRYGYGKKYGYYNSDSSKGNPR